MNKFYLERLGQDMIWKHTSDLDHYCLNHSLGCSIFSGLWETIFIFFISCLLQHSSNSLEKYSPPLFILIHLYNLLVSLSTTIWNFWKVPTTLSLLFIGKSHHLFLCIINKSNKISIHSQRFYINWDTSIRIYQI